MDQAMTNGNAKSLARVEMAGLSDIGRLRSANEDSFALLPAAGIALVADGMGGHARGELASTIAVSSTLSRLLDPEPLANHHARPPMERLVTAVAAANRDVIEAATREPEALGMGTTLLAVLFDDGRVHAAHVGDSRLYRLRESALCQMTHDQTVGAQFTKRHRQPGAEWHPPAFSHILTQAVGCNPHVTPERIALDCADGDLYLLCTDGLYSMLEDAEIRLTLQNFDANLGAAAHELVRLANQRGGLDNITVVLARPGYQTEADH